MASVRLLPALSPSWMYSRVRELARIISQMACRPPSCFGISFWLTIHLNDCANRIRI